MTQPHYQDEHVTVFHGDCLDVLRELPDASVDAVVTDPPYALNFMGRKWDRFDTSDLPVVCERCGDDDAAAGYRLCTDCLEASDEEDLRDAAMLGQQSQNWHAKATHSRGYADNNNAAFQRWCTLWAAECLRALKPGGHLLAFGGSRTWHRLACAVEDAGFEIRDSIAWLYGSGFPKSLNVAKAIESGGGRPKDIRRLAMGDDYQPSGRGRVNYDHGGGSVMNGATSDVPLSPAAQQWQGWGTALKPAFEPIVVARKPLAGTVAANVLAHGTGALNIDACRVAMTDADAAAINAKHAGMDPAAYERRPGDSLHLSTDPMPLVRAHAHDAGRWPTNVVLDDATAAELDRQSGVLTSGKMQPTHTTAGVNGRASAYGKDAAGGFTTMETYGDPGGASRFFPTFRYEAKAPTEERPRVNGIAHPTVKPLDLMRWLVRLVTPPGGIVLDPFAGSGTTAEACVIEGFRCVAIEREADYLPLIVARLTKPIPMVLDLDGGVA